MQGIFDSHAHYNDERFSEDMKSVLDFIRKNGVSNVINVGCDIETSIESINLADNYDFIYASVGVHPHEAGLVDENYIDELKKLLIKDKVIALGEIGLDYYYDFSPRDVQRKVFEEQLILAKEEYIPVIIHSREATEDTMNLLTKYVPTGVVHCFSGSKETAKEVLNLGMYIGFTGVVTFPNARKTLEVINACPLDRILLETDCPYMAPVPNRGKRCTSDMIEYTAKTIADIKGIPTQELIDIARENTIRLFNIK